MPRSSTLAEPPTAVPESMEGDDSFTAPTHEEISRLAYSYWESRGERGGSPWEDWLRAERELMRRKEL